MKKLLALALALVMCLGLLPVSAAAAGDFIIEDGEIKGYTGKGGNVTVPDGVTRIGEEAFYGCSALTGIKLPDGLQFIGDRAFSSTGLTSIVIPDGVRYVGDDAFAYDYALKSAVLPKSITRIEPGTFSDCESLTSVYIPDGVIAIQKGAFSGTGLTSITIPESVSSIGESAFANSKLTSVTLPDSVQFLYDYAFSNTDLKSVKLSSGLHRISKGTFEFCDSLTSVEIPSGVTGIYTRAFAGCDRLKDITVPAGVATIAEYAIGFKASLATGKYEPYEYGHVTIHGLAGSAAETYAGKNNIKFSADLLDPSDPVSKFTDVKAGDWYVNAVRYALEHKLFKGTSGKTFEPNTTTNRAMFVVVLARGDGQNLSGGTNWYDKAVQWAVSKGYYDGKDPEGGIPRQEMALILYRRAGSPEVSGDLSKYNDVSGISGEMRDALVWAVQTGYLKGVGGGRLNPQGTATRAEVATIFMRVFG